MRQATGNGQQLTARSLLFVMLGELVAVAMLALLPCCLARFALVSPHRWLPSKMLVDLYLVARSLLLLLQGIQIYRAPVILTVLTVSLCWQFLARKRRAPSQAPIIAVTFALALTALSFTSHWSEDQLRDCFRSRFAEIPGRLAPVITALEAYADDHEAYPASLRMLVPDYLPELPTSGLAGWPELIYPCVRRKPPPESYFLEVDVRGDSPFELWSETFCYSSQNGTWESASRLSGR